MSLFFQLFFVVASKQNIYKLQGDLFITSPEFKKIFVKNYAFNWNAVLESNNLELTILKIASLVFRYLLSVGGT